MLTDNRQYKDAGTRNSNMAVAQQRASVGNETELASFTCTEPTTDENALLKRSHTLKRKQTSCLRLYVFLDHLDTR